MTTAIIFTKSVGCHGLTILSIFKLSCRWKGKRPLRQNSHQSWVARVIQVYSLWWAEYHTVKVLLIWNLARSWNIHSSRNVLIILTPKDSMFVLVRPRLNLYYNGSVAYIPSSEGVVDVWDFWWRGVYWGVVGVFVVRCECWVNIKVNVIVFGRVVLEVNIELYWVIWDLSSLV